MKQIILSFICLLALACGAAQEDDASNDGESDIGQTSQALTSASCLPTGLYKYGVDTHGGPGIQPNQRCQIGNSSAQCKFPEYKEGFELGFTTGWSSAQRAVWDQLSPTVRATMDTILTAWVGEGGANFTHFRISPYGFDQLNVNHPDGEDICHMQAPSMSCIYELAQDPNLVEVQNVTRPTPSWWANRATTITAPLNDLVGVGCLSTAPLSESYPAQVSRCTKWLAQVDYVKAVDWANQRGFGKANILDSIAEQIMAIGAGLGQYGVGGAFAAEINSQLLDPAVGAYTIATEPRGWANGYQADTGPNPALNCVN